MRNQQNILNHRLNRQTIAGNNDASNRFTDRQPFIRAARYRSLIMGQQDTACAGGLIQDRWVISPGNFQVLHPDNVEFGPAGFDAAGDRQGPTM